MGVGRGGDAPWGRQPSLRRRSSGNVLKFVLDTTAEGCGDRPLVACLVQVNGQRQSSGCAPREAGHDSRRPRRVSWIARILTPAGQSNCYEHHPQLLGLGWLVHKVETPLDAVEAFVDPVNAPLNAGQTFLHSSYADFDVMDIRQPAIEFGLDRAERA